MKIVVSASNVILYSSLDGRTWTQQYAYGSRPATWVIDASSLIIIGTGIEISPGAYPNPDLDNSYSSVGSNSTLYADNLKVMKSETITVTGLADNAYFTLPCGDEGELKSTLASGGQATLDITGYEDLVPFSVLIAYSAGGTLSASFVDALGIFGGDVFALA